jgi:hypothetical protein
MMRAVFIIFLTVVCECAAAARRRANVLFPPFPVPYGRFTVYLLSCSSPYIEMPKETQTPAHEGPKACPLDQILCPSPPVLHPATGPAATPGPNAGPLANASTLMEALRENKLFDIRLIGSARSGGGSL